VATATLVAVDHGGTWFDARHGEPVRPLRRRARRVRGHPADTPLPWLNYLGQDDLFGLCTNTAGGYTFWRDAKLRRLTRYRYNNVPLDTGGRYLYVHDDGVVWNRAGSR